MGIKSVLIILIETSFQMLIYVMKHANSEFDTFKSHMNIRYILFTCHNVNK